MPPFLRPAGRSAELPRFRSDQPGFAKLETGIVLATGVFPAAGKTSDTPTQATHPLDHRLARRTRVGELLRKPARLEIEGVTAVLAGNAEIMTGLPPFRAMRRDPSPTDPREGDEMGELVEEGVSQLRIATFLRQILKTWIQLDLPFPRKSAARSGPHSRIPRHRHGRREGLKSKIPGEVGGDEGKGRVATRAGMGPGPRRPGCGIGCSPRLHHGIRNQPVHRSARPPRP